MSVPISVFIITKNEEARLGRTLAAVAWAEQIIIVDSGSTDRTLEIALAAGAEIHHRDFDGYGQQKSFAESLCRHGWALNIDADEVVTPALAAEIQAFIARDPAPSSCRIRILNVYPGRDRPRPLANDYNEIRLYHRAVARYRAHALFDRVESDVPPVQLDAPIHHYPIVSWGQLVTKLNAYSEFSAANAAPRSRRGLLFRLPFEMPFAFFRFYILRRHFTGGWPGFAFATISAFGRTLRIIKLLARAEERAGGDGPESTAIGER